MSAGDRKLTDFPYSEPGYGRKVAVVGIGSAGCRISNQLSKESKLLEHFLYVTCDDHDVATVNRGEKVLIDAKASGKISPFNVRGLASSKLAEIRGHLADSQVVFIIAGLGGTVGSGLAPVIARLARDNKATTVSIVVMPYNFEKPKHYFAGLALRQIRKISSGVVIIDNDQLLEKEMPVIDAFALVNEKIALALNKLLGSTEQHEFSLGLNNVIDFVKTNSYSILCLGESEKECKQAVLNAMSRFDKTVDTHEALKSIVHLCADKSITMKEVTRSIGGLSGVLGNGTMQIEYGLSANSSTGTTAIIVATGFSTTKFDCYDPVDLAMKQRAGNIDTGLDSSLGVQMLLQNLEA
ncbi:MAG: hypothetical protein ACREBQ_09660 [Nitrososphaerales archaeon]